MKSKLFLLTVLWHSLMKEVTCDGGGPKTKSWRKDFIPFNSMTFEGKISNAYWGTYFQ